MGKVFSKSRRKIKHTKTGMVLNLIPFLVTLHLIHNNYLVFSQETSDLDDHDYVPTDPFAVYGERFALMSQISETVDDTENLIQAGRRASSKKKKSKKKGTTNVCYRLSDPKSNKWSQVVYYYSKDYEKSSLAGKKVAKKVRYLRENWTVKIFCGGAAKTQMVMPEEMFCHCSSTSKNAKCQWAYYLEDEENQETGQKLIFYKDAPPKCVYSSCPLISTAGMNGRFDCTNYVKTGNRNNEDTSRYPSNTVCEISCNQNFALSSGADFAECNCDIGYHAGTLTTKSSNCKWSKWKYGDKDLKLYPKVTNDQFACKDAACSKPDDPSFGKVVCPERMNEGSVCNYECDKNYILQQKTYATCQCVDSADNTKLNKRNKKECKYVIPTRPQCVFDYSKVPACPVLTFAPTHGFINCRNKTTTLDGVERSTAGTNCDFKCNAGYEPSHESKATCICQGVSNDDCGWHMVTEPPICQPVDVCKPQNSEHENSCQNESGGNHQCINLGNGHYTCECEEGWLYNSQSNKCVRGMCPEFYSRMEKFKNGALHFKADPHCIYGIHKEIVDAQPLGDARRNASIQYRWTAEPGKYYYYRDTVCYPLCEDGYNLEGKSNYKCVCKKDDPLSCDWSDLKSIRTTGFANSECIIRGHDVIQKELEELNQNLGDEFRYLGNENQGGIYGSANLYKPEREKNEKIFGTFKPKGFGYFENGVPYEIQQPVKLHKPTNPRDIYGFKPHQNLEKDDADDDDGFRGIDEDPSAPTEEEIKVEEATIEKQNQKQNWENVWDDQWSNFECEFFGIGC